MNFAIQKTLSFILLIVIGLLLKRKIKNKEQLGGVKVLILSIALPATIFVALLKIEIEPALLMLPVLALVFNVLMWWAARHFLPLVGVEKNSPAYRTFLLLVPSLAPGLSCFPFVMEYLGEASLAKAALADVGNKVFVLIILYLVAMQMYYGLQKNRTEERPSGKKRLKSLVVALLNEPVNLVMVSAIVLLCFGLNISALPVFLEDAVLRMSALMTPMVLLFIGMAVRFNRKQFGQILQLLVLRSGLAFLFSAVILSLMAIPNTATVLLVIIFPQSAASFWPFAHMSAINVLESKEESELKQSTFNLELGLNMLAFSLPFSTLIILGVSSAGQLVATPAFAWVTGGLLMFAGLLPFLVRKVRQRHELREHHKWILANSEKRA